VAKPAAALRRGDVAKSMASTTRDEQLHWAVLRERCKHCCHRSPHKNRHRTFHSFAPSPQPPIHVWPPTSTTPDSNCNRPPPGGSGGARLHVCCVPSNRKILLLFLLQHMAYVSFVLMRYAGELESQVACGRP
jgi:hypothetical protein